MSLALVLGGGGSAAVAWEIGVVAGLADKGVTLIGIDTMVGTSAGSIVAVRLRGGRPIEDLFAAVSAPVAHKPMELDFVALNLRWAEATAGAESADDARRQIGALAIAADTMTAVRRRDQLAALVPTSAWPDEPVVVTAVSAATGRFRTFTAADGVDLLDAVGASCAVPGVWPPVVIDDEPFMDGAVRSPVNVSVAAGHDRVLVLAPLLPALGGGIARELTALGDAASVVISADAAARAAFGPNPLDPTVGPAAAREGRRQGRAAAAEVGTLLNGPVRPIG